jgi:hypothetical protein
MVAEPDQFAADSRPVKGGGVGLVHVLRMVVIVLFPVLDTIVFTGVVFDRM